MCSDTSRRTPTTRRSKPESQIEFPNQSARESMRELLTQKARDYLARFIFVERPKSRGTHVTHAPYCQSRGHPGLMAKISPVYAQYFGGLMITTL